MPAAFEALRKAGQTNERVEAYRLTAETHWANHNDPRREWEEIKALRYDELKAKISELFPYWLGRWGEQANVEDLQQAARGLMNYWTGLSVRRTGA